LARDPSRGGFLANAHLASVQVATAGWRDAFYQQQNALRDYDFPTSFAKLTKPQLAWLKRVERDFYLPFLGNRADESRRKRPADLREEVDPLFPYSPKKTDSPVRFVGDDGEYVAGSIAADEKKKLPADAIAIVQQMVFWHPQDARLYWCLASCNNANGEIKQR
jgi:hypothetical protein